MSDIRYGIFLRPDPATCWAVTQITFALERQFGLVSAGAFPPHATLVGNLCTNATERDLIRVLDPVFREAEPFPVYNAGPGRTATGGIQYDVNLDAKGEERNEPLARIAEAVREAVLPLSIPVADVSTVPVESYRFAGHLGLGSHDLSADSRRTDEVFDFIAGLPVDAPTSFVARWYSLFEFRADWSSAWWNEMTWRHLHSWDVS